ncbi:MAG: Cysteine desulfurase NifS [Candidatus Uhrbacteria bacterium GW2011_GWF2_39_13]|uniref:Cysteine desulfurase n=1 Tax=Candidatus Uhrbacteria bacterium GW2011_GWF2_39_13 TaxID=1618995 RepID=A0A0G0QNR5_9BACT|nr:MAG: Cysteine desulfurase NifS [Candidatus Uhrbacteria bacterium GW2011_GWF2_39_13]
MPEENIKTVYLDNNATTAVDPEVFEAMKPFLCDLYGNASSIHTFGGQIAAHIEKARGHVAELLGAVPSEIMFTSCGTESDNAAIFSAVQICPKRRKVVVSKVEHPAVLNVGKELERKGYRVVEVPVDSCGRIDLESLQELVDDNTALVSVMWANNEIGNIYPVEKIAEIAHKNGALFHTDAVQSVGKVPINLAKSKIDMLSLSGHKLHAPKGVGALYVRRGVRFRPFIIGGHQERGRRGGTENTASIIALGKACELARKYMDFENSEVKKMRDRLEAGVIASISSIRLNGDIENRLPNTTSIAFEYIEGESILMLLDRFGICASSGSACTTGSLEPSHVLRAMGVPYTAAHGSIRFSLSRFTTDAEIDFVLEKLPPVIERLREISPFWNSSKA